MGTGTKQISIPNKIIPLINSMCNADDFEGKTTLALVLGLYVTKVVSLSLAAELAGKSIWEFMEILKKFQIPWGEFSEEKAAMDDVALKRIAQDGYK